MQKNVVRVLAVLLVVLMCLTLLPIRSWAVGDCGHPNLDTEGWTVVRAATCVEDGSRTQVCPDCGVTVTDTIPATGEHQWTPMSGQPATCVNDGYSDYEKCAVCNAERGKTTLSATGVHTYIEQTSDAALVSAASCTQAAVYKKSCSVCGALSDETFVSGQSLGHSWEHHDAVAASCTAQGTEAYDVCTSCGATNPENAPVAVSALGHSFTILHEAVPATCTAPGTEAYYSCDREGCSATNPETPVTIPVLGHDWVDSRVLKAATCTETGTMLQTCSHPGCTETQTRTIEALHPEGHTWNESGVCSVCNISGFRITVTIQGSGSVTAGGASVTSGETLTLSPADSVLLRFIPDSGCTLDSVTVDGNEQTVTSGELSIPGTGGAHTRVTAVYTAQTTAGTEKTPWGAVIAACNDISAKQTALAIRQDLSYQFGIADATRISYDVIEVTPIWTDGSVMTSAKVKENGGMTFTVPAPIGTNESTHRFFVYHLTNSKRVSGSLTVTTSEFSPFAVFAVPLSTYSPSLVVTKSARTDVPSVSGIPFVDDGKTQTGAIADTTTAMEYRKSGSTTYDVASTGTQPVLSPGTYYVRYKETATTYAGPEATVVVGDCYTVTAEQLYGKGTYSVNAYKLPGYSNVFLVDKGDNVTFTFTPASRYWLHEINVNGRYVGQENVKRTFTVWNVHTKTQVSFGFSSSSTSPKTSDGNDVMKWTVAGMLSLIGMTTITWYLFRKKEY